MIEFLEKISDEPYQKFYRTYQNAFDAKQKNIEAVCISSLNELDQVESRYVNLKYIDSEDWIFFSNYESPKAKSFINNNKIAALFFWNKINVQIRMKATIKLSPEALSDEHFKNRSVEKNALAITSNQSKKIKSYEDVVSRYENILQDKQAMQNRPSFWGGFTFTPFYFEFWEGHNNRLNKRQEYLKDNDNWKINFLQP